MTIKEADILKSIPARIDSNKTLGMIKSDKIGPEYLHIIKTITAFNDHKISSWFDISEKTYRTLKLTRNNHIKARIQEQAIMVLSLIKHGMEVFGTAANFTSWLEKENFYFDKKAPIDFMNTLSGIKFIDDRLTGMEFGDNA